MSLELHVHEDIELAAKYYNIPLALYRENYLYMMQEDRCVFVGNVIAADFFYRGRNGKFCKSIFPIK